MRAHRHGGQLGENCTVFLTGAAEFGARTLSPTASAIEGVRPLKPRPQPDTGPVALAA